MTGKSPTFREEVRRRIEELEVLLDLELKEVPAARRWVCEGLVADAKFGMRCIMFLADFFEVEGKQK